MHPAANARKLGLMSVCSLLGETLHAFAPLSLQHHQDASIRQVPPRVVSYSVKSSCHTWFAPQGATTNAARRAAARSRRWRV